MTPEHVKTLLRTAFQEKDLISLVVESDDQVHFEACIVSQCFEGQTKLKRQQRVYAALGDLIATGAIHALALKTYTSEEFKRLNSEG